MSDNAFEEGAKSTLSAVYMITQLATYIMSAVRWFSTDHFHFWDGAKDLIWAAIPFANYFYVWDWWLTAIATGIGLTMELFK
jgi:hypothetical protein